MKNLFAFLICVLGAPTFAADVQWQSLAPASLPSYQHAVNDALTGHEIVCNKSTGSPIYTDSSDLTQGVKDLVTQSTAAFQNASGTQPLLLFSKIDTQGEKPLETSIRLDLQFTTSSDSKSLLRLDLTRTTVEKVNTNVGDLSHPDYEIVEQTHIDSASCTIK